MPPRRQGRRCWLRLPAIQTLSYQRPGRERAAAGGCRPGSVERKCRFRRRSGAVRTAGRLSPGYLAARSAPAGLGPGRAGSACRATARSRWDGDAGWPPRSSRRWATASRGWRCWSRKRSVIWRLICCGRDDAGATRRTGSMPALARRARSIRSAVRRGPALAWPNPPAFPACASCTPRRPPRSAGRSSASTRRWWRCASAAITWRPCASPRPSWAAGCARRASRSTTC